MAITNTLSKNYLVTKPDVLNKLRANNMTLQELRLFSVYLSKINPKDPSTRHVRFSVAEFQAIMELKQRNVPYLKKVANSLLSKVIILTTSRGGFDGFQLFSRFQLDTDEYGEWYISIDANENALPLLFDFKSHYFKYELWNALYLTSKNQLRMYEILKQYENIGHRIISLDDLRHWLGIEDDDYPSYKYFKRDVLTICKKALAENTDISFTFEPHSKRGRNVHELKFTIKKNKKHKDPLTLEQFVSKSDVIDGDFEDKPTQMSLEEYDAHPKYNERLAFFSDACENEFTTEQMEELYNILKEAIPGNFNDDLYCFNYISSRYKKMELRDKSSKDTDNAIKNRFHLLRYYVKNRIEL